MKKKLIGLVIIGLLAFFEGGQHTFSRILSSILDEVVLTDQGETQQAGTVQSGNVNFTELFQAKASNVQVEGTGKVSRLLADDNDGSRHQKFILTMPGGQTLLISHNIDLAPRIDGLERNDSVSFFGEYEWSSQGGVVHWTHHDPGGRHTDGWLKHRGESYE